MKRLKVYTSSSILIAIIILIVLIIHIILIRYVLVDLSFDSNTNAIHDIILKQLQITNTNNIKQINHTIHISLLPESQRTYRKRIYYKVHDFPIILPIKQLYQRNHLFHLPNFAYNYSDYILSSIIERESNSYQLYISTFFLCHQFFKFKKKHLSYISATSVHPNTTLHWMKIKEKFNQTKYNQAGKRLMNYTCRIRNSQSISSLHEEYQVSGKFIPNSLSVDQNSNKRVDILRCPLQLSQDIYNQLHDMIALNDSIRIDLYRDDDFIASFEIPWKTRHIGFANIPSTSLIDPWYGITNKKDTSTWIEKKVYLFVPSIETMIYKGSLALYLEFIEHHLQLGIEHILIATTFTYTSKQMQLLQEILKVYIKLNQVSILSLSHVDNLEYVYSLHGLQIYRDNIKNIVVNQMTYYLKGIVEFLGVWDIDELLILNQSSNIVTLPQLISLYDVNQMADGMNHPYCNIILDSLVTKAKEKFLPIKYIPFPWIGQRFSQGHEKKGYGLGFQKSIRPLKRVFMSGLHVVGTCRLSYPYHGCNETISICEKENTHIQDKSIHYFNEKVSKTDALTISTHIAFINHIQPFREDVKSSMEALNRTSYYTTYYFQKVLQGLDEKGLKALIDPNHSTFIALHLENITIPDELPDEREVSSILWDAI